MVPEITNCFPVAFVFVSSFSNHGMDGLSYCGNDGKSVANYLPVYSTYSWPDINAEASGCQRPCYSLHIVYARVSRNTGTLLITSGYAY